MLAVGSEKLYINIMNCLLSFSMQVNKRTRNKAFDILVQIGHACGDEERGGKREHLYKLFDMVLNFFPDYYFEYV